MSPFLGAAAHYTINSTYGKKLLKPLPLHVCHTFWLVGFIAECIRKRSPTSVKWKAVIRRSRHQPSCPAMHSGTLAKSHTNVISAKRLLFVMMILNDITAFTQVRNTISVYVTTFWRIAIVQWGTSEVAWKSFSQLYMYVTWVFTAETITQKICLTDYK